MLATQTFLDRKKIDPEMTIKNHENIKQLGSLQPAETILRNLVKPERHKEKG